MKSRLAPVFIAAAAILAAPLATAAQDAELTAKLQAAVAKLSPAQQGALLLLLSDLAGTPEAGAAAASADPVKEARAALADALKQFETASASGQFDLQNFLGRLSDDFKHPAVGGKAGAVGWIESLAPMLFRDGKSLLTFNIDDADIELDGDKVVIYPIDIDTPLGSVAAEITARKEADGVWRILAVDGI